MAGLEALEARAGVGRRRGDSLLRQAGRADGARVELVLPRSVELVGDVVEDAGGGELPLLARAVRGDDVGQVARVGGRADLRRVGVVRRVDLDSERVAGASSPRLGDRLETGDVRLLEGPHRQRLAAAGVAGAAAAAVIAAAAAAGAERDQRAGAQQRGRAHPRAQPSVPVLRAYHALLLGRPRPATQLIYEIITTAPRSCQGRGTNQPRGCTALKPSSATARAVA